MILYVQNGRTAPELPWSYEPTSFSLTPKSSTRTSNLSDNGKKNYKKVARDLGAMVSCSYLLAAGLYKIFTAFYKDDLLFGKRWFFIKLPSGVGTQWVTARFTEPYSAKPIGGRGWEVSFSLEIRERALSPQDVPVLVTTPLLGLHFDGSALDESGHTIAPYHWVFGYVPPTYSTSEPKFGSAAIQFAPGISEPLVSDNRGQLNLNASGEWQISLWVYPILDPIHSYMGKAILWLMSGAINGAQLSGDPDSGQFQMSTVDGDGTTYTTLSFDYCADIEGVPTNVTLHDMVDGSPVHIPVDQWSFIAVVGDATSTRAYINGVLAQDDHDAVRLVGHAPMWAGVAYLNQHFVVGSAFSGGMGPDSIFPADSVYTNGWSGKMDDLCVRSGLNSVEYTGETITVPTAPFGVAPASSPSPPTSVGPVLRAGVGMTSEMWTELAAQQATFSDTNTGIKARIDAIPTTGAAVSPGGNINAALAANSVVILLEGTHIISGAGVAVPDNKMLIGEPGKIVTLDCHSDNAFRGVSAGNNTVVANLIIDGAEDSGLLTFNGDYSSGSLFYQLSVRRTGWYSSVSTGSDGIYVAYGSNDNVFVTVEVSDSWNPLGGSNANGGNSDGIANKYGSVRNSYIDVHAYRNGDDGIDCWGEADGSNGGGFMAYFCTFNEQGQVTGRTNDGNGGGVKFGPSSEQCKLYKTRADNNTGAGYNLNPGTNPTPALPVMVQSYGSGNGDGDYINGMPTPP